MLDRDGGRQHHGGDQQATACRTIEAALADLGLGFESPRAGAYLVRLEGQHKLATMTWLIVGAHSLHVEAFFCRQPDENHAAFYRFLLERSGRMYGVHFALDPVGDVYLVGRLPLACGQPEEIDRLLGCVLSYSDENFDQALMIGFASSIRREWAWRVSGARAWPTCAPSPAWPTHRMAPPRQTPNHSARRARDPSDRMIGYLDANGPPGTG